MQMNWLIFSILSAAPAVFTIDIGIRPSSLTEAKEIRLDVTGRKYTDYCGLLSWLASHRFRLSRFEHGGSRLVLQKIATTPQLVMVYPFFPFSDWREFVALEIPHGAQTTNIVKWHSVVNNISASGDLKLDEVNAWLRKDFPSVKYVAITVSNVLTSTQSTMDMIVALGKIVDDKVGLELDCEGSIMKAAKRGEQQTKGMVNGPGHPFPPQ